MCACGGQCGGTCTGGACAPKGAPRRKVTTAPMPWGGSRMQMATLAVANRPPRAPAALSDGSGDTSGNAYKDLGVSGDDPTKPGAYTGPDLPDTGPKTANTGVADGSLSGGGNNSSNIGNTLVGAIAGLGAVGKSLAGGGGGNTQQTASNTSALLNAHQQSTQSNTQPGTTPTTYLGMTGTQAAIAGTGVAALVIGIGVAIFRR